MKLFALSAYTDIEKYHQHEERHVFYMQMLKEILSRINFYQEKFGKQIDVLEIGAGTGLLTKHLVDNRKIRLSCLEPDKRSLPVLKRIIENKSVNLLQIKAEDLSHQNEYDLIVSSFSHDHVKESLRLAKKLFDALRAGGVYVCGVEILPKYSDKDEYIQSLEKWHGYVIDKAKDDGYDELAKLENEALASGKEGVADFKKDEENFEKDFSQAGFKLTEKIKIGPDSPSDIGGVYVYVFLKQ